MADGSVIVVEMQGRRVTRCWDGRTEIVCEIGGGPNGAAVGPDGALWICNNGGIGATGAGSEGRIERIDLATGRFERVYDSCDGVALEGPNDLVFSSDGRLWFTDLGKHRGANRTFSALFSCLPDGSSIDALQRDAISYNGIGLSPDQKTVYVADTFQARIYAFDARPEAQRPRFIATVPGDVWLDSLAVTQAGNVCVGTLHQGGISTVTPGGKVAFRPIPEEVYVTNIAFGGSDMTEAYITLSTQGKLVHVQWDEPGLPLSFNA
jgi:gluconolactonase